MAQTLLVWGLHTEDWSQGKNVIAKHERFGHLRACVEPDWQAFGSSEDTAAADLIQLAEWLGCRDEPHALPQHKAVCLARGAAAVLAALKHAGGAAALAEADPAAASCLGLGFMQAAGDFRRRWLPSGTRDRVADAFAVLGPFFLVTAAADLRHDVPGSAQRACTAGWLTDSYLQSHGSAEACDEQRVCRLAVVPAGFGRSGPAACLDLLQAVADALSDWSAAVGSAEQQQKQVAGTAQQAAQLRLVDELREASVWLPLAVGSLLQCMERRAWLKAVDERRVVDTLGHLVHKVVLLRHMSEHAAAAGLWAPESNLPAATCVGQLHRVIVAMMPTKDMSVLPTVEQATRAAAGWPALHAAVLRALGIALGHLADSLHVGLLLYLSLLAHATRLDGPCRKDMVTFMAQLSRVQQLAVSWLTVPPPSAEPPCSRAAEVLPVTVERLPFKDRV